MEGLIVGVLLIIICFNKILHGYYVFLGEELYVFSHSTFNPLGASPKNKKLKTKKTINEYFKILLWIFFLLLSPPAFKNYPLPPLKLKKVERVRGSLSHLPP